MNKILPLLIALFLLETSISKKINASPPIVSNIPSEITINQSFSVNVSFNGLTENKIYRLRIAFSKPGESKYFGGTWNGSDWYTAESPIDYSKFFSITTDENGAWNGDVQGKISYGIPNFDGTLGVYDFKIGRYTETGTTATWSEINQITLNDPNPPTPTQIPTNTPFPSNTPTPSSPPTQTPTPSKIPTSTKTPTPIKMPTATRTPTPTKTPTPVNNPSSQTVIVKTLENTPITSKNNASTLEGFSGKVLGLKEITATNESALVGTKSISIENKRISPTITIAKSSKYNSTNILPIIIIGGLLILTSGGMIYKKHHGIIDE